jgi:hypothetical protein
MKTYQLTTLLLLLKTNILHYIVFSMPHQLVSLFKMEEELVYKLNMATRLYKSDTLDLYLQTCQPRFNQLPAFSHLQQVLQTIFSKLCAFLFLARVLVDLVGNPIHVYSLMDRLVMQLPLLRKELAGQHRTAAIEESIGSLVEEMEMPDENDLEGVTQAIARIQFAYRLDPVELANGKIKEVQTEGKLSVKQMMNIAERRISGRSPLRPAIGKEFALAIEWAEGALTVAKNDEPMEKFITKFLQKARLEHNNNWHTAVVIFKMKNFSSTKL